jgi:hypothetical protein
MCMCCSALARERGWPAPRCAGDAVRAPDVQRHGAGPGGRALHGRPMRHPAGVAGAGGRRAPGRGRGAGPGRRHAHAALASGDTLAYDLLSLDTGSVMDRDRIPGAREHGLFVRPIEHFVRCSTRCWRWRSNACWTWWWSAAGRRGSNWRWRCSSGWPGRVTNGRAWPGHRRAAALVRLPADGDRARPERAGPRRVTVFQDACAAHRAGTLHLATARGWPAMPRSSPPAATHRPTWPAAGCSWTSAASC